MKISQKGIDLIKSFEGCRLTSYKCPAGVWTIGYGHTAGVKQGQTISQAQAESFLREDLAKYEGYVTKTNLSLNQGQFDALVSFTYNCGQGNLKTLIKNRTLPQIADALLLYNKAAGKVLAGLTRRRKAERELFLKDCATATNGQSDIITYSLSKDGDKSITTNFKVKEFKCKDGSDVIVIDTGFVKTYLQKIRTHFNAPVTINSAYRTASYNKKVGGATKSYHLTGQAFDIVVKGRTPVEVAKYAQSLGIKGIIKYNSFVHVDSRTSKYRATNNGSKDTVVSSF